MNEIPLNKEFLWGDTYCLVPSIYSSEEELVVDFLLRVPAEEIHAFMDKWNLSVGNDSCEHFTREQQMELDADNPLDLDFRLEAAVNGRPLQAFRSSGTSWNPCVPQEHRAYAKEDSMIQKYSLDTAYGWNMHRCRFCWVKEPCLEIKSLSLTLKPCSVSVPGPHFGVTEPGDSFSFTCPGTGELHTLTVQEIEQQEMKEEHRFFQGQELPTHYTAMTYIIEPELPNGVLRIEDCADSDSPRGEKSRGVSAVAIIGGSSGPVGMTLGKEKKLRTACSSLHFEPAEQVEWRLVFQEKRKEDLTVTFYV